MVQLVEMYPHRHQHEFHRCWTILLEYLPTLVLPPSPLYSHHLSKRMVLIVGAGTYASVQSIIDDYAVGAIRAPFSCADNGL